MILLTLALLAAPAALPAADPQRRARAATARRARVRSTRTVHLLPIVRQQHDPNAKYRVAGTDERIDFKTRVVERGAAAECGVTGMPVCPSKGMPILQSEPR